MSLLRQACLWQMDLQPPQEKKNVGVYLYRCAAVAPSRPPPPHCQTDSVNRATFLMSPPAHLHIYGNWLGWREGKKPKKNTKALIIMLCRLSRACFRSPTCRPLRPGENLLPHRFRIWECPRSVYHPYL